MNFNNKEKMSEAAFLFHSALGEEVDLLLGEIKKIAQLSPFRQMRTRRGIMSVEMTNCGELGWLSDSRGYRYTEIDPLTQKAWPMMPSWVKSLATESALIAGFGQFHPNVCLINKYEPGTKLGMHIDKGEGDIQQSIVAFSFGLPAIFRWGGLNSNDATKDFLLSHGDVVVWGGKDRLRYHGIRKVYESDLYTPMSERLVMTFRYSKFRTRI